MSDENFDNGKPKGFDISKLGVEVSDEERAAADERMREQFKELTKGSAVMADALRGVGGATALQEAMGSVNNLQDAIKASGIGGINEQVKEAISGLATSGIQDQLSDLTGAGFMDHLSAERTAVEEARKALGVLPEGYMESPTGAMGAVSQQRRPRPASSRKK